MHNELNREKIFQFQMGVWVVARLPQTLKSTFFEKDSSEGSPKRTWSKEIFFKKILILVFEVIVQPPKHTFVIGIFFHGLAHCELPQGGVSKINVC